MRPTTLKYFINDTAGDLIGTYKYQDLDPIPAVAIGEPDSNVKVEGLEVIISKFPSVPMACRAGNLSYRTEHHKVTIWLHPTTGEQEHQGMERLYDFIDFIYRYFPHIRGNNIEQNKQFQSLPGYQFYITTTDFSNTRDADQQHIPFGGREHYENFRDRR